MAAPPAHSVLALIKAFRPTFNSPAEKVSFAAHAICTINGLKLVAIGDRANQDPSGPEADLDGWNSKDGEYTFLYGVDQAVAPPGAALLLKCLIMDDTLLLTLLASSSNSGSGIPPGPHGAKKQAHLPETLELSLTRHAVPEGGGPAAALAPGQYGHLQDLVNAVHTAIETQLDLLPKAQGASMAAASNSSAAAAATASRGQAGRGRESVSDEAYYPESSLRAPPYRSPLMVGGEDLMPGGFYDPLRVPGPSGRPGGAAGGGGGFGPLGPTGGGMHVGPGHPFFSDRLRNPGLVGGPGGLGGGGLHGPGGGGARWDPIAPEGLQGWNPEDFQRGGPRRGEGPPVHPDMMQPGPGRGADWDHMFG